MPAEPEPRTVGIAPIVTWFSGPVFSRARDIFAANTTDLLDRAFGGSPARLAMQALSTKKASAEELAELRQLLDTLEGEEES